MDYLPAGLLDGLGTVAVVLAGAWFLFTGRVVTRREVEQMQRNHDRELDDIAHDRDEWRAESRIKDQQIAEKDEQLGHLEEVGRTVAQVMSGVQARVVPPKEDR